MTVMPGDPGDVQKSLARLKFLGRGKKREILKHAQRIQKYIAETKSQKLIFKPFNDLAKIFHELTGVCTQRNRRSLG